MKNSVKGNESERMKHRHLEEGCRDEEKRKQLTCDQTHLHQSWWWHGCPMPVEQTELVRLWALRACDLAFSEYGCMYVFPFRAVIIFINLPVRVKFFSSIGRL
jgi:hypothetical protein